LKTALYVLLGLLYFNCNPSSGNDDASEDSLQYYPLTPTGLDQKEFRYYYRVLADYFDSSLNGSFNGGILIAKNGTIIYEKYSGYADLRTKELLSDNTSLHIASASKPFTAIAILLMADQKKISLDDSLAAFFPGLPYPGITVKMLLNHRSGLPNYIYFADKSEWDKKQYMTNNDVLNLLYSLQPKRSFPPNTHFSYSNTNYVLLALIIEKISGKTFPEYMRQNLFEPLQMKNTYVFTLADSLTATSSFDWNGNYWKNDFLEATYGDKNIYSTPGDLLKWDQALYSGQLLSQPLLDSAFTPYSLERASVHNYGLGWRLLLLPGGKKVIYHFGRWHGFNAAFARLPDEKATIIILGNRFTRSIYNAAYHCYDIFGDYHQDKGADEEEADSTETSKKDAKPKTRK